MTGSSFRLVIITTRLDTRIIDRRNCVVSSSYLFLSVLIHSPTNQEHGEHENIRLIISLSLTSSCGSSSVSHRVVVMSDEVDCAWLAPDGLIIADHRRVRWTAERRRARRRAPALPVFYSNLHCAPQVGAHPDLTSNSL